MTAAQALVDIRNQFDRYTDPDKVEWHFAGIANQWTKRALVASGFGADRASVAAVREKGVKEPLIAVTNASSNSAEVRAVVDSKRIDDVEAGEITPVNSTRVNGRLVPVYGVNRPYFHVDVETAFKSVAQNVSSGSDSN